MTQPTGTPGTPEPTTDEPQGPHSRACGITPHPHGLWCSDDCPTCHGKPALGAPFPTVIEPAELVPAGDPDPVDDLEKKVEEVEPVEVDDPRLDALRALVLAEREDREASDDLRRAQERQQAARGALIDARAAATEAIARSLR